MAICPNCGKDTGKNKMYCSQVCRAEYLKNQRKCIICGKLFWASPSSEKMTCSPECERKNRSFNGNLDYSLKNLEKAREASAASPNSGQHETSAIAKSWKICSPEGVVYEVNNIELWSREHADIIPSDPKQFACGIREIKYTLLGKKKRGSTQYKGWTLLEWSEENKAREGMQDPKRHPKRTKMTEDERLERKRSRAREYYRKKKLGMISND